MMNADTVEDMEYETYRKTCNDLEEAKQFYHQYLESLVQSVKCRNIQDFQKYDENDEGNNAYYYAIRSNDIGILKDLIKKLPIEIDDIALSKGYFNLILQGVKLSDDMKNFVEYTLTKTRLEQCILGNIEQPKREGQELLDDVKTRSIFLVRCISNLPLSHENNTKEVDEKILYCLKVIAINLYILKSCLRCTYDRLPWEEIEFCLVMYIKYFKSTDESGLIYRYYVKTENIFNYLKEFSKELSKVSSTLEPADLQSKLKGTREEIVTEISCENPTFKDLYETFSKVRDFYSLQTMLHSLRHVLDSNKPEDISESDAVLLIERCLHILGESMKHTVISPNLSKELGDAISDCFPDYLSKALQNIRDCLSHRDNLRRRADTSYYDIMRIKDELIEITPIIEQIYLRVKYMTWRDICNKAKSIKEFKELSRLNETLNYAHISQSEIGIFGQCKTSGVMANFLEFKSEVLRIRDDLQLELDQVEELLYDMSRVFEFKQDEIIKESMLAIVNAFPVFDSMHDGETIRHYIESLKHSIQIGAVEFSDLKTMDSFHQFDVSRKLKNIIDICISSDIFSKSNLIMYMARICALLLIGKKCFKSIMNYNKKLSKKKQSSSNNKIGNDQKSTNKKQASQKVQNCSKTDATFSEDMVEKKIKHLNSILERHNVKDSFESVNTFISSHRNQKIFYVLEMLLLDILSIYELNSNTNLLDFYFPTLLGRELRNHLAHQNSALEVLSFNMKLCVVANCVAIAYHISHPGKVTDEIPSQLKTDELTNHFDFNTGLVQSKIDFFESLKSNRLHEILKVSGVDILARSIEGFTVLHAVAHNPYVEVFDHYFDEIDKQLNLLDTENIYKQNLIHVAAFSNNLDVIEKILEKGDALNLLHSFDYKGYIPLHYASSFGTTEMIKLLLGYNKSSVYVDSKKSVQAITNSKTTITLPTVRPIHKAIESNNIDIFKILLNHEKDLLENFTDEKHSIVHLAAQHENPEFIKILVDRQINVNIRSIDGFTPLHAACHYGRLENVKILLSKKANLNALIFATNQEPIAFAIAKNHTDIVEYLLTKDKQLYYMNKVYHRNLLHIAAASAGSDIIKGLIKRRVIFNNKDITGQTVLHVAVKHRNLEAIKTFLKHGLNVNVTDYHGRTPLHQAALIKDNEIFELLYNHKAKSDILDNLFGATATQIALLLGNEDMMQSLTTLKIPIYEKENWKWIAYNKNMDVIQNYFEKYNRNYIEGLSELLFIAIISSNIDLFKYFIKLGANFDYSVKAISPLLKPVWAFAPFLSMEATRKVELPARPIDLVIAFHNICIIEILLKEYENHEHKMYCFSAVQASLRFLYGHQKKNKALERITNFLIDRVPEKKFREQLLESAIMNNNTNVVKLLLELKLDIDLKILVTAMENGYMSLCNLLIDKGKINLISQLDNGETILHIAVQHCDTFVVELLIRKGCKVNAENNKGIRPIDYAAHTGQASTVAVLLHKKAEPSQSIFVAIKMDHEEIVRKLCEKGLPHNKGNNDYISKSLHYAILRGSQKCIKVLLANEDINVNFTVKGYAPLHCAAFVRDLDTTKKLLKKGADASADRGGEWKPIHSAATQGHLDIVKYYIENEYVDPTEKTRNGYSWQYFFSSQKNIEPVELISSPNIEDEHVWFETYKLLKDVRAKYKKDKQNITLLDLAHNETLFGLSLCKSLDLALQNDNLKFCTFLEENHSYLNLNSEFGKNYPSLLHTFVQKQDEEIVKILLKYKADPNVYDSNLETPLHYAVKLTNVKIVQALLFAGADYNMKNYDDLTAIDIDNNGTIKQVLDHFDKCFQWLEEFLRLIQREEEQANFLELIQNVGEHQDQVRALFSSGNRQKQSLYTYIVKHEMSSVKTEVENYLKKNIGCNETEWKKAFEEGEYSEAEQIILRVITKYEEEFGTNNPLTIDVRIHLLEIQFQLQKFEFCLQENEKIIKELIELYGKDGKLVLASRSFHAAIHQELGDYEKALKICECVCEKQLRLLGSSHEAVLLTKSRKVKALVALKRLEEALELQREVYNETKRKFGENHPVTLTSFEDVGSILNNLGLVTEAANIFDSLYSKRRMIFGPTHDETLNTFSRYIETLMAGGKYVKAVNEFKSIYYGLPVEVFGRKYQTTDRIKKQFNESWRTRGDINVIKNLPKSMKHSFWPFTDSPPISREGRMPAKSDHELKYLFRFIRNYCCAQVLYLIHTNKELVHASDEDGVTPLHLAVESNNLQIFRLLMACGADPFPKTDEGMSILHVAVKKHHFEMAITIINDILKLFSDQPRDIFDIANFFVFHGIEDVGDIYRFLGIDEKTILQIAENTNSDALLSFIRVRFRFPRFRNFRHPPEIGGPDRALFEIHKTIFEMKAAPNLYESQPYFIRRSIH